MYPGLDLTSRGETVLVTELDKNENVPNRTENQKVDSSMEYAQAEESSTIGENKISPTRWSDDNRRIDICREVAEWQGEQFEYLMKNKRAHDHKNLEAESCTITIKNICLVVMAEYGNDCVLVIDETKVL